MGEVHRAEDLDEAEDSPGRVVALKLIRRRRSGTLVETRTDPQAVERFAREVRIMHLLSHPNLPRTIDGGVDETNGDLPFLVMEFLDGHPLADLVSEEGQLPVPWVAAIGAQMADALAAAHAAGVVHRDLKPRNVMLTRGGAVKVLDFGIGRIVDDPDGTKLTSTGVTVGTARYMAPEQFEGSLVTQAADLYALGCMLHEMLLGNPPFMGNTAFDFRDKHVNQEPTPVRLLRSDVSEALARLVDRLLAKNPADRPADAVAVRDALLPLVAEGSALPVWQDFDPVKWLLRPANEAASVTEPRLYEPTAPEPAKRS
ncbi:serine/threonine-protein kinase [Streptomyces sp. M10(2022)]